VKKRTESADNHRGKGAVAAGVDRALKAHVRQGGETKFARGASGS